MSRTVPGGRLPTVSCPTPENGLHPGEPDRKQSLRPTPVRGLEPSSTFGRNLPSRGVTPVNLETPSVPPY